MPQGIDLAVDRGFGADLIALEALHDARVQGFAQQFVDLRMLFIDISGKEEPGAHILCLA